MRAYSTEYYKAINKPLRNEVDIVAKIGAVNREELDNASLLINSGDLENASRDPDTFTKQSGILNYATFENNITKADGLSYFRPIISGYSSVNKNIEFNTLGDVPNEKLRPRVPIRISVGTTPISFDGITFYFGDLNHPYYMNIYYGDKAFTNLMIESNTYYFQNSFVDFTGEITVIFFLEPYRRLRINQISLGLGLVLDASNIYTYSSDDYCNSITNELPTQSVSLQVIDYSGVFDYDNPNSMIGFFEKNQTVTVEMAYKHDDGTKEWFKMNTSYLSSWSYSENVLTLTSKDFLQNDETERVKYIHSIKSNQDYANYLTSAIKENTEQANFDVTSFSTNQYNFRPLYADFDTSVKAKEQLQILSNFSCGLLKIMPSGLIKFTNTSKAEYTISSNSQDKSAEARLPYSGSRDYYATYEHDTYMADGTSFFPPRPFSGERTKKAGYVGYYAVILNPLPDENENVVIDPEYDNVHVKSVSGVFDFSFSDNLAHDLSNITINFSVRIPPKVTVKASRQFYEDETIVYYPDSMSLSLVGFEHDAQTVLITVQAFNDSSKFIYVDSIAYDTNGNYTLISNNLIDNFASVEQKEAYKTVKYSITTFTKKSTAEEIASGTYESGDTKQYIDTEPIYWDLTPTNCTVDNYGFKEVALTTTSTVGTEWKVTGYKMNESKSYQAINVGDKGDVLTLENPLCQSDVIDENYDTYLKEYYSNNKEYTFKYRGCLALEAGDVIKVENKYETMKIRIIRNSLTYESGALNGTITGRRVN